MITNGILVGSSEITMFLAADGVEVAEKIHHPGPKFKIRLLTVDANEVIAAGDVVGEATEQIDRDATHTHTGATAQP